MVDSDNIGLAFAKAEGDAHEDYPGNPLGDKAMDLHNNEIGRLAHGKTGTGCMDDVNYAFEHNQLWWYKPYSGLPNPNYDPVTRKPLNSLLSTSWGDAAPYAAPPAPVLGYEGDPGDYFEANWMSILADDDETTVVRIEWAPVYWSSSFLSTTEAASDGRAAGGPFPNGSSGMRVRVRYENGAGVGPWSPWSNTF
jgi:hypothetical protein